MSSSSENDSSILGLEMVSLNDVFKRLNRFDRLMGVDLGEKTIGLAMSDVERKLASPLQTIRRTKFNVDAQTMINLTESFQIAGFVIGLPLNMDGSRGPRVQATQAFVRNFGRCLVAAQQNKFFVYWDERLSTAAVTRELIAQNVSRARRSTVVDQMAAAYILQGALDRMATLTQQKHTS